MSSKSVEYDELYKMVKSGLITVTERSPAVVRFFNYIDKNGPHHPALGKCWTWVGTKTDYQGYGAICVNGKGQKAHRFSYELHYDVIPNGLCVLHDCDNPSCVNPQHLSIGTRTDNARDRTARKREARGTRNRASKLSMEIAREVRRRYVPGCRINGCNAMAREFGVTVVAIFQIIHNKTWREDG